MKYVCTGATLKCTMGTSCPKLKATPKNVSLTGKDQANIADYVSMVNIPSFGRCRSLAYPPTASATAAAHGKLTPMPCVPGTCLKWQIIDKDSLICGEPALLKPATLKCMYGGTISIVDPGQTLEIKARAVLPQTKNKKSEKEIPEELLQEFNELDTEGLNKESVLDGIQLALDAAGMVPLFGAIPDLINASISVLRGDWVGAGLSVLAAVPLVGDVAGGAKLAYKGAKIAKNAQKSSKVIGNIAKKTDNITSNVAVKSDNIVPKISLDEKKNIAKKYIDKDVSKDALLKEKGVTPDNVDEVYRQVKIERKREAIAFYKEHTLPQNIDKKLIKKERANLASQINGIDFNYKIEKGVVNKGDIMYQYSVDGRTGNYLTHNPNHSTSDLGISSQIFDDKTGKFKMRELIEIKFEEGGLPYLRSTAKEITDTWSNKIMRESGKTYTKKVETKGGGIQTFIPGRSWKENSISKKRADVIYL